ncbi:MAG: hypothetical protein RDU20_14595 [Desulfomonilaceae bacterium]|nr:hypothetical protein [Desulfomonilaceae bacterium]
MRRYYCLLVATFFLLILPVQVVAESAVPDLKGTWIVKDYGVRHHLSQDPPAKTHAETRARFLEVDFTITIDTQEGFRFSGTKSSKKWKEAISGVIGFDNKTVYMVDDNGFSFCRLVSPDTMEHIYLHATPHHSAVARGTMKRKR